MLTLGMKVEQTNTSVAIGLDSVGQKMEQVGSGVAKGLTSMEEQIEKLRLDALNALEEQLHGLSRDIECKHSI